MITDQDKQELLHYQPKQPMLSVYLNTDPAEGNADFHRRKLRALVKEIPLTRDVDVVIHFIERQHDWTGKSVAIFSCAAENFFRAYPLAIPIRSRVRVSEQPYVKPIADLLDSYGGYGVVLVDKQGARYFSFHLGELQEREGSLGETIRRTKRGGGSQAAGRRGGMAGQTDYVEEATERNMREVVDFATRFFTENNVRRVLIGGTDDNVALFRTQLPKAWQSLVVGSFSISMLASDAEVLEKAMLIGAAAEQQREIQLVKMIVTNTAKGRAAVLGLQNTLEAIRDGRVQMLIIRDGYRQSGYRCLGCGNISATQSEVCAFCGGKIEALEDAVEHAVASVMRSGGEVEVLRRDHKTNGFDQIGALLRF